MDSSAGALTTLACQVTAHKLVYSHTILRLFTRLNDTLTHKQKLASQRQPARFLEVVAKWLARRRVEANKSESGRDILDGDGVVTLSIYLII